MYFISRQFMQARKKNKFNVLWKILYILNQEIWRDTSRQFMKEEVIEKKCNSFFWKFLYSIRILGDAQTWFLCKKLYVLLQDIWTYTSGQLKRSKQLEMWFLWKILHYFWMYVKNLNNIIDDEQKYYINYVSV